MHASNSSIEEAEEGESLKFKASVGCLARPCSPEESNRGVRWLSGG